MLPGIGVPLVVAHRGCSASAPENTMVAFRRAVEEGADMIEMDVRMSKDGHWVVHHDRRLGRTSAGRGRVWEMPLARLRTVDAGSWFSRRFTGEKIPLLTEVLEWLPERIGLNVEVKTDGDPRSTAVYPEELLRAIGPAVQGERLLVSSFDHGFLERMHRIEPAWVLGAIYMPVRDARRRVTSIRRRTGASVLVCSRSQLGRQVARNARRNGMAVACYGVNTLEHLTMVSARGVDAVITDRPGVIRRAIEKGS